MKGRDLNLCSCLIVAGEKSGEEHALSFFKELKSLNSQTHFFGVGGDDLAREGVELLYHLKDFSSMGFSEVIQKIPFYWRALKKIEHEVIKRKAQTAILVDFQDFNMLLAKRLKKRGVKVLYYVAPQAWAWKEGRTHSLKKNVHTLFSILPFEKDWFLKRGVDQVVSVAHPLLRRFTGELDHLPERSFNSWSPKLKLLLLPGSRKSEVLSLLPAFIEVIKILKSKRPHHPHLPHEIEVHLVKVPHLSADLYDAFSEYIDVEYDSDRLTDALKTCHFCLAASGTVTLAAGLFELPTIVCYRSSLLNEFIFHQFIRYNGPVSLTNIIHQKMIFPEYLQDEIIPTRIADQLLSWTMDKKKYNDLKNTLKSTKILLAGEKISIPDLMTRVIHE